MSEAKRILIVDDDQSTATLVATALTRAGYEARPVNAYSDGERSLGSERWDLVVSDLYLDGGKTGLDLLRGRSEPVPFILMTGAADIDTSIEALKAGAADYLPKPLTLDHLVATVQRALVERASPAQPPREHDPGEPRLVGRTPGMVEVYKAIAAAAPVESPVLIAGEEGAGKELVALEIHRRGARAAGPFVVTSGASRLERDLRRLRRSCGGGTLVLRRVNELPPEAQYALSRLIEAERSVRWIGTLRSAAEDGSLVPELRYALSAIRIDVPPLRERTADLPLLVEELLRRLEPRVGKSLRLAPESLVELAAHPWKGNVRELQSVLEAAGIASRSGEIVPEGIRRVLSERTESARPGIFCPACGKTCAPGAPPHACGKGAEETSASCLVPHFKNNRYLPYRLLARGDQSEVWLAWQPALSRRVVIKFLDCIGTEEEERFNREAKIHASLNHPRIPAVFEAGVDEVNPSRRYLVMALVEGTSLDAYNRMLAVRTDAASRLRTMVRLIADAAGVLEYIHGLGLVHRDVKPQNVVVTAAEEAHVIDYGLARPVAGSNQMTLHGTVQGTVPFMSPEHISGRPADLDARSDVWSLGAALYYLLTDRHPFGTGEFDVVAQNIRTREPESPSALNPLVSPGLEQVILRALEKRPERRFARAGDLQAALLAELERSA